VTSSHCEYGPLKAAFSFRRATSSVALLLRINAVLASSTRGIGKAIQSFEDAERTM
jgi:hypothetical protein